MLRSAAVPERPYDDTYRLTEATGREKVAQTQTTAFYGTYAGATGNVPDATTTALRNYTQTFTYDAVGNLTEVKHANGTVLWRRGYNLASNNNQLLTSSLPGDDPDDAGTHSASYAYDDRGNLVFLPHLKTGVSANLTRDFRDHIRKAELDNAGNVAWYAYDAAGQRVRKQVIKGAVVEERINVGSFEVWRKTSSGSLTEERETVHAMDDKSRVAMFETKTVDAGTVVSLPVTRARHQLDDHLGTACVEVDGDGGVITYEEYHPYGSTAWYAEKSGIDVSKKRYKYTGMEKDDETGLQLHGVRYYAPWLGRWCRPDPIGLGDGVNRFGYVRGNPVRGRDPSGLGTDDQSPVGSAQGVSASPVVRKELYTPAVYYYPDSYRSSEYIAFDSPTMDAALVQLAEYRLNDLVRREEEAMRRHGFGPSSLPSPSLVGISEAWSDPDSLQYYDPLAVEAYEYALQNPLDAVAVYVLRQLSDSTGLSKKEFAALIYIPVSLEEEFGVQNPTTFEQRTKSRRNPRGLEGHIRIDYYEGSGRPKRKGGYTVEGLPKVGQEFYDAAAHSHPIIWKTDRYAHGGSRMRINTGFSEGDRGWGIGSVQVEGGVASSFAVPMYLADHRVIPGMMGQLERVYLRHDTSAGTWGMGILTNSNGTSMGAGIGEEPSPHQVAPPFWP